MIITLIKKLIQLYTSTKKIKTSVCTEHFDPVPDIDKNKKPNKDKKTK